MAWYVRGEWHGAVRKIRHMTGGSRGPPLKMSPPQNPLRRRQRNFLWFTHFRLLVLRVSSIGTSELYWTFQSEAECAKYGAFVMEYVVSYTPPHCHLYVNGTVV